MKYQNKIPILVVTLIALSMINLVSAVTLDNGTVLNTSVSNSSLTFSDSIEVTSVVIEDVNITLTGITCSDGGYSPITSLFWNNTNENMDSSWYCGAVLFLKFNENQGTTAYDVSGNGNNGTITGATYNNDGINITLTSATDYTYSSSIFTILNSLYSWDQIFISYNYNRVTNQQGNTAMTSIVSGLVGFASWIVIIVVVIGAAIVLVIIKFNMGVGKNII